MKQFTQYRFIFSALTFVISLFYLLSAILVYSTSQAKIEGYAWGEFYFFGMLLLIFLVSAYSLFPIDTSPQQPSLSRFSVIGLLTVTAAAFLLRLYFINHMSLWVDEASEVDLARFYLPARAGAGETQPPLSCLTIAAVTQLLGLSEFYVRLHIVIASVLASAYLFLALSLFVRQTWLNLTYAVVFAVTPVMIQYSYEVRPIALGVMHGLLLLAVTGLFVFNQKTASFKDYAFFGGVGLLFLNSVGLQAPFICGSLFVALILAAIVFRKNLYFKLSLAILGAVLIFLPFQYYIRISSANVFRPLSSDSITAFFQYIMKEAWPYFAKQGLYLSTILLFLAVVVMALYWRTRKRTSNEQKTLLQAIFIFTTTLIVFYTVLPAYFVSFIDGTLALRYTLTGWSLIVLSTALCIQYILSFTSHKTATTYGVAIFLILGVPLSLFSPSSERIVTRFDVRGLMNWLEENSTQRDLIYRACFPIKNDFCPRNLSHPGAAIYYNSPKPKGVLLEARQDADLWPALQSENDYDRLIVYFDQEARGLPIGIEDFIGVQGADYLNVSGYSVVVFSGGPEKIRTNWWAFIKNVEARANNQSTDVSEYLLQKALIDKNKADFIKYKKTLSSLINAQPVERRIIDLEFYRNLELKIFGDLSE